MKKLVLAACCVIVTTGALFAAPRKATSAPQSTAKARTGVGFTTQFSQIGATSLSLRSWISDSLGVEGALGFTSGDVNSAVNLGAKVLAPLKKEQNLTLYGFGMLGFESISKIGTVSKSETDVTVGAGVGVEFFFQGLPNLGFGTEIGLSYGGLTDAKQFGTFASWIPSVGMRYYFQ